MTAVYFNQVLHSDVNPYELVSFKGVKSALIRPMKAKAKQMVAAVPGGFAAHFDNSRQAWDITSDPEAPTLVIRLHKDGQWRSPGGSRFVQSEIPIKRYDYNF